MKKRWMALFLAIVLTAALFGPVESAAAETYPTTNVQLTYIDGTKGVSDHEGPACLVDDNPYTHWCTKQTDHPYCIFKADKAISIAGYVLITGDDCQRWKNRNPYTWTLYGSNASSTPKRNSSTWKVIDHRAEDTVMQDVNCHGYSFLLEKSSPKYRYFMLVVEKHHGASVMQLGDMRLFAASAPDTFHLIATPTKGTKGVSDNEGYSRLVDGSVGTKWCVSVKNEPYCIFKLNKSVQVTGYKLFTGDDTANYQKRNPVSWELYGMSAKSAPGRNNSKWVLLHKVTKSQKMPEENYAPAEFKLSKTSDYYNYFMLVVKATAGADLVQIGELTLNIKQSYPSCVFYPDGSASSPNTNSGGGGGGGGGSKPDLRCPRCNGSGRIDCSYCYGRGTVEKYVMGDARHNGYYKQETCPKCHGSRTLECPHCHGSGRF